MTKGVICKIERFALNDGPGIRTLVFFKGCPLKCKWCSNPESQNFLPDLYYYDNKCKLCTKCIGVCPNKAIVTDIRGKKVLTDRNRCDLCGRCISACLEGARSIVGEEWSVDQVMKEVKKDIPFYISTDGGVTLSGGEVLGQVEFAMEILQACQDECLNTTLETCGYAPWRTLNNLLSLVDLVLFDLKHMDPDKHRKLTGVNNDLILSNLARLDKTDADYIVRMPLIPTINDDKKNLKDLIAFLQGLNNVKGFHLLPYHTLGRSKYRYLERPYELKDLTPLQQEDLAQIVNNFEKAGIDVLIGG